jgi:preprotein translocase subunit SecA
LIGKLLSKVIGTTNERELKRLWPIVGEVNVLEPQMQKLSDAELRAKTEEFRQRVRESIQRAAPNEVQAEEEETSSKAKRDPVLEEALKEVLPEAFAVVREAGRRVLNMRHFDVQLIGGAVLHQGKIAETIWPSATRSGWASSTPSWDCQLA